MGTSGRTVKVTEKMYAILRSLRDAAPARITMNDVIEDALSDDDIAEILYRYKHLSPPDEEEDDDEDTDEEKDDDED
jgi:hypothetical protein